MVSKLEFGYESYQSEHERFSEIVYRLLLSNKAPVLERLQISFIRLGCGAVDVGMWIGIAYAHHVHVPSHACLKSLRTLHLHYVDYKDHSSFPNLLFGCPNLENLLLRHNQYYGQIFTIAVPSLRTLTIYDYNDEKDFVGYVINAPSLKYLNIHGFKALNCCLIENAPELVEANIDKSLK
ncbi:hypothetical protein DY000_02011000 [Brassica cretica]|uniref:F-box/LRR-repeat protein 15/At3g58940/PEG3-like LRR domain-containing protein n=1 Tax=Brassica cretica TaxID=69181 RepID=A0ABQ7D841_BRACR|nr:hypothetical protein DY000_02011000 [Brassica cretica]